MSKPPVILIEVGTDPEGLPRPVITKDDSITSVVVDWDDDMEVEYIDLCLRVLGPLRHDHPRFDIVCGRLELRRQKALVP